MEENHIRENLPFNLSRYHHLFNQPIKSGFFRFHTEVRSCRTCLLCLTCLTELSAPWVHPRCCKWQDFFLFFLRLSDVPSITDHFLLPRAPATPLYSNKVFLPTGFPYPLLRSPHLLLEWTAYVPGARGPIQFGVPTLRSPPLLPGRGPACPDPWVPQAGLHTGGDIKPTWPACYACHLWVPSPSPGLQNLCFWCGLWVTLVVAMFDSCTHLPCTPSPSVADLSSP